MSGWHAKLSASAAYRWMNCPGSAREIDAYGINETSRYAAEGTAAHELASNCLLDESNPIDHLGEEIEADGFTFTVNDDMVEAVTVYVDYCRKLMVEDEPGDFAWIEHSLTEELVKLHPEFGGTADFVAVYPRQSKLVVVDYKHGAGVYVNVEGNKQLRYYALGALLAVDAEVDDPIQTVETVIIQPRCYSEDGAIRTEEFSAFDLIDYAGELVESAKATEDPDAPLIAGGHCDWCPARHACPELEKHQKHLVSADFDMVDTLEPEKLAEALDILPAVESRIKAIRARAYKMAMNGQPPPGYALYPKRATRKFVEGAEVELLTVEEAWNTEPKLKSPAQLEKALGKARYKELCEDEERPLVTKEPSGYNLAPVSSTKQPALPATIDDFEEVN